MIFGIGKSTKVDIHLAVDRPVTPYYPGDPILVNMRLQAEDSGKGMKMREVRVCLIHSERYQYKDEDSDGDTMSYWTTDENVAAKKVVLEQGTIEPGFSQTYGFRWQLPTDALPPTQGKITQSRWLVRATVDRKLRGDVNEEIELPVVVPPPNRYVQAGHHGQSSHPAEAFMQIWLPKQEWLEGETIQGQLHVQSHKEFNLREIRAELMRHELVPRDEGNSSAVLVTKQLLAQVVHLVPHHTLELPFDLAIPQQGCPTANTKNSQVYWQIRATLTRGLKKDYTALADVLVYNGPAKGWSEMG